MNSLWVIQCVPWKWSPFSWIYHLRTKIIFETFNFSAFHMISDTLWKGHGWLSAVLMVIERFHVTFAFASRSMYCGNKKSMEAWGLALLHILKQGHYLEQMQIWLVMFDLSVLGHPYSPSIAFWCHIKEEILKYSINYRSLKKRSSFPKPDKSTFFINLRYLYYKLLKIKN